MNRKIGFYAALAGCLATALFAVSMAAELPLLSYASSMLISWGYVCFACANAAGAAEDRKGAALAGVAFAAMYAVFVNLVYFSQLTVVAQHVYSADISALLTYLPGGFMFAVDLLGYGLMAMSTLFVGLSLVPKNRVDRWMKALLLLHGLFAPACAILPMTTLFSAGGAGSDTTGVIALFSWCVYFIPVMILSAIHFKKAKA